MNMTDYLANELGDKLDLASMNNPLFSDTPKFGHLQTKRPKKISAWQRLEARKEALQLQRELEQLIVK